MGLQQSIPEKELPSSKSEATLYYFGGRGMADKIRWLLAYSEVSFTQRVMREREQFVKLCDNGQLAFAKLPLLQIDGIDLVDSHAIVRYLAKRANLIGKTAKDELACDIVSGHIFDMTAPLMRAPFERAKGEEADKAHKKVLIAAFDKGAVRLEMCIERNTRKGNKGAAYLIGDCITYADIMLAHMLTWYAEECGQEIVTDEFPWMLAVQHAVLEKDSLRNFLSGNQFYPLGGKTYAAQVGEVLGRKI